MANDGPQNRNTLQDWEQHLAPQVRQVELLGEITVTAEEWQQLGQSIGPYLHNPNLSATVINLRHKFPCAFVVFLAAQGIHDYRGPAGFWPGVGETIGKALNAASTRQLGLLFEEILTAHKLPLFPQVTAKSFRYVSLILLHGGIPNYSLDDYFDKMLRPAVTREVFADMAADELIEDWLLSSKIFFTDKPVLRFLEFGGLIAEDFVDRTRELAREFLETGLMPAAKEVGLPQRVVEAFHTWAVENEGFGPPERSQRERTGLRLRKPEIWLDPWGEGITLDLPPQQIPATLSQAQIEWTIQADGILLGTLPVRLRRAGYDLRTTHETLSLHQPAELYEISLQFNGETQRNWQYRGPNQEHPLIVFDLARGTLLRQGNSLPARPLWLLYPRTAEINFEGEAKKLEEFPPLPWGWAAFQGEAWDLSQTTKLTLRRDGNEIFSTPIRPDEASQRPHLVGGNLFIAPSSDAPTPTYTGIPPAVRIPLVGRTNLVEELARWRLTLRNPWAAEPTVDLRSVPLTEFRPYLIHKDGYVELPLNISELLGDAPTGTYTLRLRGPLGRDAELPFRLLSHFFITGHENIYLPHPKNGPPEIKLLIETAANMTIECQPEAEQCQVNLLEQQPDCSMYEIIVPPEAVETRLVVVQPIGDDDLVRVPVRIPVRRLRWTLASGQSQTTSLHLERTGWMIKQSLDALEQSESPVLFVGYGQSVQTTGLEAESPEPESLSLSLVDLDDQELMHLPVTKPRQSHGRSVWRFELVRFLDTIRHSSSPVVRFELEYPHVDGLVRLPVLSLTRSMIVSNVNLEAAPPAEGQLEFSLTWQEDVRLRHRRVRFWPLWRSWLPPYEVPIPDEAEATLTFQAPAASLPIGAYLIEFLVVDPWVGTTRVEQPASGAPNMAMVEMITPEQRIAQINRVIQQDGPRPDLFLERAHIRHQIGEPEGSEADCKRCYERLDESTVPQILDLCDLVQQNIDSSLLGPLRLKMFAANRVQRVLDARSAGEITVTQYQTYFTHLPQKLLPVPACEKLLGVDDDKIKMYAILQLVRRGEESGISAVLDLVQRKTLSYTNASEIMKLNIDLAVEHLEEQLDNPTAVQLIEKISPNRSAVVREGHWVRSRAGWGILTRIENKDDDQSLDYFIKGQSNLRLHVTLRPRHDAEKVVIEVLNDRHRVYFRHAEKLCRCTKGNNCDFITKDQNLLVSDHNRVAHGGLSPQFSIERKLQFVSVKTLVYSVRAPRNMLS
jgi:hypothetical protein